LDLGKAGKTWMVILKLMMLLQNKTSGEELMTRVQDTTVTKSDIGWHAVTDRTDVVFRLELKLRAVQFGT